MGFESMSRIRYLLKHAESMKKIDSCEQSGVDGALDADNPHSRDRHRC